MAGIAEANPYAAWISAGTQVLTATMQKPPETNISGVTSQPVINSWFDGAGWTVSTGASKATGGTVGDKGNGSGLSTGAASSLFGSTPFILGVATLIGLMLWKS